MKILKYSLIVLAFITLTLVAVTVALFWAPDTARDEIKAKYGAGVSKFIDLDGGGELHYRDQGLASGRALVFIHGTSASLHTWEPLIKRLGDHYRLISLDLPGHGLTGANAARDYSLQAMIDAIWLLLDHLNIGSASLVGNSLGGGVAWAAALDKPNRVNSLILLSPSGAPRTTVSKSNIGFKILRTSIGQSLMKKITPRPIIETSLRQSVSIESMISERMIDRYWELLRLSGNRQAMIDLANTPRDHNAWKKLHLIKAPVMLIWGEEDGLLPVSMAATFKNEIEDLNFIKLKGIGHLAMEEDVQTVSQTIISFCNARRC